MQSTSTPWPRSPAPVPLCFVCVGLLGSCTGSTEVTDEDPTNVDSGFVASVVVTNPSGDTSFVGFARETLDSSAEIDVTQNAIEVPGRAILWSTPDGAMLVAYPESLRFRRFVLQGGGLVEDGEVSLLNEGSNLPFSNGNLVFGEDNRAYVNLIASSQRFVEFDYVDMVITNRFDIPREAIKDGWIVFQGYETTYVDGQVYSAVGWFNWDNADHLPTTGLVVVDVESGSVSFDEAEGCHGLYRFFLAEDGFLDGASGFEPAWHFAAFGNGVNSCARRVRAGETSWDDDYLVDLDALVEGKSPYAVGVSGDEGHIWVAAINQDFDPTGLSPFDFFQARGAFTWNRINLSNPSEPVVTSPRAAIGPDYFVKPVGGKTFVLESAADGLGFNKTVLLDATGEQLVEYARFNGYLVGLVELEEKAPRNGDKSGPSKEAPRSPGILLTQELLPTPEKVRFQLPKVPRLLTPPSDRAKDGTQGPQDEKEHNITAG